MSTAVTEAPREKTLHELNLEQRKFDRQLRAMNDEAADAAKQAVAGVLDGKRPDGKRVRKPLRPVAE